MTPSRTPPTMALLGGLALVVSLMGLGASTERGEVGGAKRREFLEAGELDTASLLQRAGQWRLVNFTAQRTAAAKPDRPGSPGRWPGPDLQDSRGRGDSGFQHSLSHRQNSSRLLELHHWLERLHPLALEQRHSGVASSGAATSDLAREMYVMPVVAVVIVAFACYLAAFNLCGGRRAVDSRTLGPETPGMAGAGRSRAGEPARRTWNLRRDPLGTAGLAGAQAPAPGAQACPKGAPDTVTAAPAIKEVPAQQVGPAPGSQGLARPPSRYACR